MKPFLSSLLRFLPSWLRPVRKVDCAWVGERLAAYSDWDLPEDEFEAVGAHLQGCAACRQSLAETEKLLRSFRATLPSADPAVRFPRRCAAATMAYILAAENQPVTLASFFRSLQQRQVHAALACLALLLLSILAFVVHQGPDSKPGPVPVASIPSIPTVADAAPDDTAIDLGMTDQLQEEFAETLALLELRAMVPATEKELEIWARREYPADMWLHDLLREQYGYQGSWQHLLRQGGAFLRFDYPLNATQPNCRPSISALQRVAEVAQFTLTLTPDGDIALPEHDWAEGPLPIRSARLERTVHTAVGFSTPPPPPAEYSRRIAENDGLAKPVVAYLLVSGRTAEAPLASLSPKWNALLLDRLSATSTADGCSCCTPTFAARFQALLEERQALIQSITPE